MDFNGLPDILTVKQLAECLQLSDVTIKRALKSGELQGFKAGRDWRITRESVASWLRLDNESPSVSQDTELKMSVVKAHREVFTQKDIIPLPSFGVLAGVRVEEYDGGRIPSDSVTFGSVFFVDGLGFGIVFIHAAEGVIVRARTASGTVSFVLDNESQTYACYPIISRDDYRSTHSDANEGENKYDEYLGHCVERIAFLGVLPIPQIIAEDGSFVDGCADFGVVDGMLRSYISDYELDYRPHVRDRRIREHLYKKCKDDPNTFISEGAENFDPSKCEYLCSMTDIIQEDMYTIMYYRNPHGGRYFSCILDISFSEASEDAVNAVRLLNAVFDESKPKPKFLYEVNYIAVNVLTDEEADRCLRRAVREGRMSPAAYSKYFGEYAGQNKQIAARIPFSLKKRIEWTGLTIERLLELGCEAYLASVQSDFEAPAEETL